MNGSRLLILLAIGLSLVGSYVSLELFGKHLPSHGESGWLDAVCEGGSDGSRSCDRVLTSRWGVFPPLAEGETETAGHIPVAYLGLAYFTFLAVWYLLVGTPSHARRGWHLLPLGINGIGLAGSIWFIYLMATATDAWCVLCLVTHGINLLLFGVGYLAWRRLKASSLDEAAVKEKSPVKGKAQPAQAEPVSEPGHPSWRIGLAVLLLSGSLMALEYASGRVKKLSADHAKLTELADEVQSSVDTLMALFRGAEPQDIEIHDDDPVRYDGDDRTTIVIWSDFDCPHCRTFHKLFHEKFMKNLDGYVRVVFKYFPMSNECNPYLQDNPHVLACQNAYLAEAVRTVYGQEKFWEMHDKLFELQPRIRQVDPIKMCEGLGLDVERLNNAIGNPKLGQRIQRDIRQGIKHGVTTTPAIFVDGRRVHAAARNVPGFWFEIYRTLAIVKQKKQQQQGG